MAGLQNRWFAELNAIVTSLAARVAVDDPDPLVLQLLLGQYRRTGREDLFAALGPALARGLSCCDGPEWLTALCDALAISDDELVVDGARRLLAAERDATLPSGIEAALRGAAALGATDAIAGIVDNLERLVAMRYEPGDEMRDPVATASALLAAYEITGRLPYAMLAEELVQIARLRDRDHEDVIAAFHAARVLCGLSALHADADYRAAAVIAPDADYRSDAERLIARYEPQPLEHPRETAAFGLALARWLDLQ